MTDTVGFIRRLPTQLVEGFASTLEETLVADLVLHVVDASASDERLEEMIDSVETVLHEIGADDVPVELVLNKIDLVDPLGRRRLANAFPARCRYTLVLRVVLAVLVALVALVLGRGLGGGRSGARLAVLLHHLVDRALQQEQPLRDVVVLALDDLLEGAHRVGHLHVLAGAGR